MTEYITEWYWDERRNAPNQAQREEIVRCRDCMHFATYELGDYCTLLDFEDVKSMENKFCAWGERDA